MKTIYILLLSIVNALNGLAQNSNFPRDYQTFLDNQQYPLLSSHEEVFMLDGTPWRRYYGEKEYALTPSAPDVQEYTARVKGSRFSFVRLEVTQASKSLLLNAGIQIPEYVETSVIAYLPEVDVDILKLHNVDVQEVLGYGQTKGQPVSNPIQRAMIFSDGFEAAFPGTIYTTYAIGAANCGWDDVSCANNSGSWSVWGSSAGAACNSSCTSHVNDMNSGFYLTNSLNTSAYMNLQFNYAIWIDQNDADAADFFRRWEWLGSSFVVGATYYSSSSEDEAGWLSKAVSYQGIYQSYNFQFQQWSDGSWTSDGVYIDDVQVSGAVNGINDYMIENAFNVYPIPSNGIFTISRSLPFENVQYSVKTILGESLFESSEVANQFSIDLSNQPSGVYFLYVTTESGIAVKKLTLNK